MTSRQDVEEILEIIRQDDALREEVRRHILTEELLKLPTRFTGLEEKVDRIGAAVLDLTQGQASFRGVYAEEAATADDHNIAGLFAHRHGLDSQYVETWHMGRGRLRGLANDNEDSIRALPLRGRNPIASFRRPDIIAEVKSTRDGAGDPARFYITVEASYTVQAKDYHRATDNAKIVECLLDAVVYPVVAGVQLSDRLDEFVKSHIHADVETFIRVQDPDMAYFHRLEPEEMEPASPQ